MSERFDVATSYYESHSSQYFQRLPSTEHRRISARIRRRSAAVAARPSRVERSRLGVANNGAINTAAKAVSAALYNGSVRTAADDGRRMRRRRRRRCLSYFHGRIPLSERSLDYRASQRRPLPRSEQTTAPGNSFPICAAA